MKKTNLIGLALFLSLVLVACTQGEPIPTAGGASGACSADGQQTCSGECVQTRTDGLHCGGCNNRCPEGLVCRTGVCTDPMRVNMCEGEGREVCGDECADLTTDPNHCGACGRACADGANCSNGRCTGDPECSGLGEQMCVGICVNTNNDIQHCGGCNNRCDGGARCAEGLCVCGPDLTYCDGQCVNIMRDIRHCGTCLDPCSQGLTCLGGQCLQAHEEFCDGRDNDLDGEVDENQMGSALTRVCDNLCGAGSEYCVAGQFQGCDAPAPVNEVCDEADNDCDGVTDEGVSTTYYEDFDGDGFGDPNLAFSVQACARPEHASPNGGVYVDNDDDCNDVNDARHPGAEEICDELDNDCDDNVDERCVCQPVGGVRECGTNQGICVRGTQQCTNEGWGPCGGPELVSPAEREQCNNLDDDCDGVVDEDLGDDDFEPNDRCQIARQLPNVGEGAEPVRVNNATLHHGDEEAGLDEDWYIFTTREALHLDCLEHFLEPQCNFIYEAALRVPDGANPNDYVLCMYEGGCGGPRFCTNDPRGARYDEANQAWILRLNGPGVCGIEDNKTFAVQVRYVGQGQPDNACETYTLSLAFAFVPQECR